jgi:hypothetical protein
MEKITGLKALYKKGFVGKQQRVNGCLDKTCSG